MMTERNPNNVDGNIPDLLQKWFVLKPTPNQTISNIQKVQKTQNTSPTNLDSRKNPMKPGAFGALQGNQTSGFDVNDVLNDHLPFFFRSFHAMYV